MNRRILALTLSTLALLSGAIFAVAQTSGSAAEAKAMFDRAIAAFKANDLRHRSRRKASRYRVKSGSRFRRVSRTVVDP